MRVRPLLPALLLAAAAPAAGQEAQVYTNPVVSRPRGVADPFVLKYNGEYYLYATGNPIMAYHSTDLVTWEEIGPVLHGSGEPGAWNGADVWAPEVVYRDGRFYLYYTATLASPDWRVGEMARRVGVAVSDSPRGPFVDSGRPVTPGWAIDGHVFRDPDGGREYLFYSYLWEPRLPGAGIVVDSLLDPFHVAGTPSNVTKGSEPWEDKDADPFNGSLRYTNEAPTVLKHDGLYYVMYSGGSWDLPSYSLAWAASPRLMDGGLDGPGWAKVVPPLLRSTPLVDAPGHNAVVAAPDNVELISAYHARVVPFDGPGDRQTFLGRVYWHRDRLFMEQPTLGARPAPDRPLFRDLFDGPDGDLGAGWRVESGGWRRAGGEVQGSGLALVDAPALEAYVLEANVRPGGGRAGVAAWYGGPGDRVDVWLDGGRHALVTGGVRGGRALPERSTPLPAGFRADAYHQLLVTKNAGMLQIALDGVIQPALGVPEEAGRAGLQARGGRAAFDGVALTAYFRDAFDGPTLPAWETSGGTWLPEEGALHQVQGGAARYLALKGEPAEDYELIASLRWRDEESVASTAGVVAAAAGEDLVVAGFDRTIWPFARFHVRHLRGGAVQSELAVEMPRGFRYDVYHNLRVVKQGTDFTFYLDGVEVAAARFPLGAARAGLYTEGVRAAFDDVSVKRLGSARNLLLNGGFEALPREAAATAPPAPWQLSGAATVNMCCGHSGIYRLRIGGAGGEARQVVPGLRPGDYSLLGWATTRGATAQLSVAPQGGAAVSASASGEAWHRVRVDFSVPEGASGATVSVAGRFEGADSFVAADDLYLLRR